VRRTATLALLALAAVTPASALAAPAPAQPPPPTATGATTGTTTASTTTTTTAPAAPIPCTRPPHLSSLRLAKLVTGQQGHAQFLVGARLSCQSTLTVRVTSAKTKQLVRTVTGEEASPGGRKYVLIEATTEQRFQLPTGVYRVEVQATDAQDRTSNILKGNFRLKLTTPRGRLDAYTVPLWPSLARLLKTQPGGQLVAVVAPGGAAAKAGMRRGDVITAINGRDVSTPGDLPIALRSLPARKAVQVDFRRGAATRTVLVSPPPDWQQAPDYARAFRVALKRQPGVLAYAYAAARQLMDAGKSADAKALMESWTRSWQESASGQLLQGELLLADNQAKPALGAFNRALRGDPDILGAQFGRGLGLSRLGRTVEAADAFQKVQTADPNDAAAAGFRAYLLVEEKKPAEAVQAAEQAIALDPLYEDGYLAKGLALLSAKRRASGLRFLKTGLLLLSDQARAQQLITQNLEPNDP
jgi:Tfp pilus assembly protein PilF